MKKKLYTLLAICFLASTAVFAQHGSNSDIPLTTIEKLNYKQVKLIVTNALADLTLHKPKEYQRFFVATTVCCTFQSNTINIRCTRPGTTMYYINGRKVDQETGEFLSSQNYVFPDSAKPVLSGASAEDNLVSPLANTNILDHPAYANFIAKP